MKPQRCTQPDCNKLTTDYYVIPAQRIFSGSGKQLGGRTEPGIACRDCFEKGIARESRDAYRPMQKENDE